MLYDQRHVDSAAKSLADDSADVIFELCQTFLADQDGDIVVLRAYLDESGTHDASPVVVSAACYAKASVWRDFTRLWNRRKGSIKIYHATDAQNLRNEFDGWTGDQVADLTKRLFPTVPECEIHAVIVGIDLRAFDKALKDHPELRAMLGTPYCACLQWVFMEMRDMFNRRGVFEPLAFVHERNDFKVEAEAAFEAVMGKEKRGGFTPTLTFGEKSEFVPLQAADAVAYEMNRYLRRGRPAWSEARRSLQALNPKMENFIFQGLDEAAMPDMIAKLKQIRIEDSFSKWVASRPQRS